MPKGSTVKVSRRQLSRIGVARPGSSLCHSLSPGHDSAPVQSTRTAVRVRTDGETNSLRAEARYISTLRWPRQLHEVHSCGLRTHCFNATLGDVTCCSVAGDQTGPLLWRIKYGGELAIVNRPRIAYVMIGANDFRANPCHGNPLALLARVQAVFNRYEDSLCEGHLICARSEPGISSSHDMACH